MAIGCSAPVNRYSRACSSCYRWSGNSGRAGLGLSDGKHIVTCCMAAMKKVILIMDQELIVEETATKIYWF